MSLEELFTYIQDSQADAVHLANRVSVLPDDEFVHVFEVVVKVTSRNRPEEFRFEVGRVPADHEMHEDKKESSPEYARFQQALVSMFHRVNTIEGRIRLIKRTSLPNLQVIVEA